LKKIPFNKAKELDSRVTEELHESLVKRYESVQYWLDTKNNVLQIYSRGIKRAWFILNRNN